MKGLFIMDAGYEHTIKWDNNETTTLPRYAVWIYSDSKGKPQVAEVSNDLEYLKAKYNCEKILTLKEK